VTNRELLEQAPTVRLARGVAPQGQKRIFVVTLGARTGWAMRWDAATVASGVEPFDDRTPGARMLRFRGWTRQMLRACQPTVVGYTAAVNFEGVLLAELEGLYDHVIAPTPEARDVVTAARVRWGRMVGDEQEASALCVLAWVVDLLG
jgi:hypothetical protein